MGVDNWHYHSDTNSYEVRGWSSGEDTGRVFRITFPEGCGVETHSQFRASTNSAEPSAITDQVLRLLGSRVRTTESALDLLDTATEVAYGDGEGAGLDDGVAVAEFRRLGGLAGDAGEFFHPQGAELAGVERGAAGEEEEAAAGRHFAGCEVESAEDG